jgi:eukaryotic-like serine/threonine-protein kinase
MPDTHRDRVLRVYHAALAREGAERDQFLARECNEDDDVRRDVEALLAADPPSAFLNGLPADDALPPALHRPSLRGRRIGSFVVGERIGSGGMGDVYRASDTRLGRDVAIKVLPPAFSSDAERVVRFEREARVLAALDHPHIATIHGVEDADGVHALVLALVEGETLADRLAAGAISLGDALQYARQIADALETAHDRGIVHRDLKPGNIKVTPEGAIKVLDFGLAMTVPVLFDRSHGDGRTPPVQVTREGTLIGSVAYMSPEQAAGRPIDKRADVWAFGCVLFEMVTGQRAFPGDAAVEVLGAIMSAEPDWRQVPDSVPAPIRRLLRRCLEKDLERRLPHLGVARLEIDDVFQSGNMPAPGRARQRWLWGLAGVAVAGTIAALMLWPAGSRAPTGPTPQVVRFSEPLVRPAGDWHLPQLAISPDGGQIVYVSTGGLYLRSIGDDDGRLIAGSEGIVSNPAFSPDGRSIAFFSGDASSGGAIKIVPIDGGSATYLISLDFPPYGMSWTDAGMLFGRSFGKGEKGVVRVPLAGGPEEQLIRTGEEFVHGPQLLPDGQTILFTLAAGLSADRWDKARIVAQSLTSGERRVLVEGGADARYLPSGHLLYARGDSVFAVSFDAERNEVRGATVPVVRGVARANAPFSGAAHIVASGTGALVYVPASQPSYDLAIIGQDGAVRRLPFPSAAYRYPRISPDASRLAVGIENGDDAEIWVGELKGLDALRRLTFDGRNRFPVWSANGERIAFQSDRDGDAGIFWQRADGTDRAERLTAATAGESHFPLVWSPNGESLLFDVARGADYSLWSYSTKTGETSRVGDVGSGIPPNAVISPDGRWIAYNTRDSDKFLISVQPFPPTGARYQVAEGGIFPAWSADGRQLFYFHGPSMLSMVEVLQRPVLTVGRPQDLWRQGTDKQMMGTGSVPRRGFDIMPSGTFLSLAPAGGSVANEGKRLQVVINWGEELRRLVPPR